MTNTPKYKRTLRRDLVHAAGCTEPYCASVQSAKSLYDGESIVQEAVQLGVRIPRSLRKFTKHWKNQKQEPR